MKLILGNPGSGKTKRILAISAEKNVPVLAESPQRVQRLLVKAQGYGIDIPTPITIDQLDGTIKEVIVDDIERFMSIALGVKIDALAINRDGSYELEEYE